MSATEYDFTFPGGARRITASLAAEFHREAQGNGAAQLDGDLEAGFTYLSALGQCSVRPVAETGPGGGTLSARG